MTDNDSTENEDRPESQSSETEPSSTESRTPGGGRRPRAHPIAPAVPEEFGLVQSWWGDGKGKTTAALGMAFRAAGHGYRVHMLQFMKGGAASVEDVRGEYNAIAQMPGMSYENLGHYGWHAMADGTEETDHAAGAEAGLERVTELVTGWADVDLHTPFEPDSAPEDGVHMLVLDEILYAANRELISPEAVVELIERKPDALELVLTGGHEEPTYLSEHADLVSHVGKEIHPFDEGTRARKGAEY